MSHRFSYNWTLANTTFTKDKGTVFSCFACGGGSTMGYKLAGFNVLGCNEIDPKMMEVYKANHNPQYAFCEPIQAFKLRNDLPQDLYELDILDGSPPCSSFSSVGNREKDWGKEKKFREGQAKQVLDTLFFDFLDVAKKLQPKVVIAENVKGLILGSAKEYMRKIYWAYDEAGYTAQLFLLDAATMGVPQQRERVFIIGLRKDLASPFMEQANLFTKLPRLQLVFNEPAITYQAIREDIGRKASALYYTRWQQRVMTDTRFGDITARLNGTGSCFSDVFAKAHRPLPTITSKGGVYDFDSGHFISDASFIKGGSFPLDYDFLDNKVSYVIGMSVPPVMTAQIATQIYDQWLRHIYHGSR